MTLSLRHRLLAVTLLAAVACAGALFAIVRLADNDRAHRVERAREVVVQEIERARDDGGRALRPRFAGRRRGERRLLSGTVPEEFAGASRKVAPRIRAARDEVVRASAAEGGLVVRERALPEGVLVVGAAPDGRGGYAWAAVPVFTPREMRPWRWGVFVLAFASLALVAASLHTLATLGRGVAALRRSLGALARDLAAPVERPALRELRDVADGIASLAGDLARTQDERSRLGRELAERERLAALGRVAAGVAHEVRNPLASIKLRADLAQRARDVPAEVARDLGEISSEVARLDRLVADLLVMTGRRTGPRVATDLAALARRRVELLAPWAAERGVAVACSGAGVATLDVDAFARVVDNLARNAVEASAPGQRVALRVAQEGGVVRLGVADEGPGVPPDKAAELFEPFFTTKADGTGLGLALSRAIAAAHGGTLTYRREGRATVFEVAVPAVHSPEEVA